MPKPILAVDIDEVLFPFTEEFLKEHNRKHNTDIEPTDLQSFYYIEELLGITDEQEAEDVVEAFLDAAYSGKIGPLSGAEAALEQLKEHYQIDIVTARRPTAQAITEKWLKRHFPDTFRGVHFPRSGAVATVDKAQYCKQLGASILIDDSPHNVIGCVDVGIRGILFGDYGWTPAELPEGVTRVKDWDEVLRELL